MIDTFIACYLNDEKEISSQCELFTNWWQKSLSNK